VLPVEDLSPQKDQEPLCLGMLDDIITKLSSIEGLRVTPKLSVLKYKNTDKDIKEIGKELKVENILMPTLQRENDKIRVNIRLINAKEGFLIKPYSYERNIEGYFQVQDEISNDIAKALKVRLVEKRFKAIKKREPTDIEAYDYCVKVNFYQRKYSYFENE
jgi:adenylate cyclase